MMLQDVKTLNVLVVEDIENMRVTIVKMLLSLGFKTVFQAKNGIEALSNLQNHDIHMIISDIGMPLMDGMTMLTHIRKNREWDTIPIIIISSVVNQTMVTKAIKLGISQYIVKPFSQKILSSRIQKALTNPINISLQPENEATKVEETNVEQSKLSILVVDDVPENIHIITNTLKGDYLLRAATSGKQALDICFSNTPPDLVLLDIMMPEMDGLEVMRALNENVNSPLLKVIFLSALSENENIIKGLELGAVDYITKPISPAILKARVSTHANIIRAQQASNNQIDSMLESIRVRNDFERIMQHDLKNQLLVINSTTSDIRKNLRSPETVSYMLNVLDSGTQLINQIIDNMVFIHRIEDGNYQFQPLKITLSEVIETVISANAITIKEKHLEINTDIVDSAVVMAELALTHSIINNLVQNALQAAPNGSAVSIGVHRDKEWTMIDIHNAGVVPISIQETFFEKYSTFGKKGGSGMGTYAVKLMTEIQQGQVSFITSSADGTTLTVKLPSAV
ncbi:ATP-binding response regulator [Shewanella donghaensis]|uniref:ATP-binding response regulator n=1 Tax=Shewanella donghaensis TaxID=238836 RepID=UPI001182C0DE|nr:response regulator [Shewanella donghaensis]